MDAEQQKGMTDQLPLFGEEAMVRPLKGGEAGSRSDDSMDAEQQKGMTDQLPLFGEEAMVRPLKGGEAGSRSARTGERQATSVSEGNPWQQTP